MTSNLAMFGLMLLFVADYVGIVVWLMRTASVPDRNISFSLRNLFVGMTIIAIHLAAFAAFLNDLARQAH